MNFVRATWMVFFAAAATLLYHSLPVTAGASGVTSPQEQPRVVELTLRNTLQPVSAKALQKSLDDANRLRPAAILINLSSPGGLPESAAAMALSIRHSAAPIIVYAGAPRTEVAGEALLLLNAGAASAMHPYSVLRPSRSASLWSWRNHAPLPLHREMLADVQEQRRMQGRKVTLPAALLENGSGLSAEDARDAGLVDVLANTPERVLSSLDGKQVVVNGQPKRLQLQNFGLRPMPPAIGDHLMRAVMNPDLTVLLLTLGSLLVYLEINTPGSVLPGAFGLLLVLLSFYAFHNMPLRWEGVTLLGVSVGMLFAEATFEKGSTYGVLSVISLVFGLRLLVRGPIPELEVDWSTAVCAAIGFGGITAGLLLLGVRAKRAKVRIGAEAMIGWLGVAQTPLDPAGQVLVRGELWNATLSSDKSFLAVGECVTVQQFQGKVLQVAPLPSPTQAG